MKRQRWQVRLKSFNNRNHGISHIELKCIIKNQIEPYFYKTIQCGNISGKISHTRDNLSSWIGQPDFQLGQAPADVLYPSTGKDDY